MLKLAVVDVVVKQGYGAKSC